MSLLGAALGTVLVNLPFGWFREGTRKFSVGWFVAIHAPVPLVILIRRQAGVSLALGTLPFLLLAYFVGQAAGARLRRRRAQNRIR